MQCRRVVNPWAFMLALSVACAVAGPTHAIPPEIADPGWVVDGTVADLATSPDGLVYMAGDFMLAAPRTGPFAQVAPGAGAPSPSPELVGTINAVASDGAGGWFVGGQMHVAERPAFQNLVHIRPGGELDDAWQPSPDGTVTVIAVDNRTVYVGGDFNQIANPRVQRVRIAAIDRATARARDGWSASPNGAVSALLLDAGYLYVAGAFTSFGTTERNRAAALSASDGALQAWDPNANGDVSALGRVGSSIILGGSFTTVKDVPRARLAAVDTAGTLTGWDPSSDGSVRAITTGPGGAVIIGGAFGQVAGEARRMIASIDPQSGRVSSWNPQLDGAGNARVDSLALSGGKVIAGGEFVAAGSATRRRLAGIDITSGVIGSWPPSATGRVVSLAPAPDGGLGIGGNFGGIGGVERHRLAAFNAATGAPTPWNPDADGPMRSVAVSGSTIVAGGEMRTVGGVPREGLAAIDAATGSATALRADANGSVDDLAISSGTVYLAGRFSTIASLPRAGAAAIDLASGALTPWNPSPDGPVSDLTPSRSGQGIVIGGSFAAIGGGRPQAARPALAEVDGVSGSTGPWRPSLVGPGSKVNAVWGQPGGVIVGGNLILGAVAATNLASVDAQTGGVRPLAEVTGGEIRALALFQGHIYLAGAFDEAAHDGRSTSRAGIAGFDPGAEVITAWNPGIVGAGPVGALAQFGPSLWLGGAFGSVGGRAQSGIASFTQPPTPATPAAVLGPPVVGATLRCRGAIWDLVASTRTDWIRDGEIIGSGVTYQPTPSDRGRAVACNEVATNRGGVANSTSASVAVVGALPKIEGAPRVGSLLSCVTDPLGGAIFWTRGLTGPVVGSGPRYRASWGDAGRRLACQVRLPAEGETPQPVSSLPSAKVLPTFSVPDRRGIQSAKVVRGRGVLVVVPGRIPQRSEERPRLIAVRVQATRAGLVRIRIGGGGQGVRFARPGRANVQVRAGAAFLPPLRRLPVEVTVYSGGRRSVHRTTIRLTR